MRTLFLVGIETTDCCSGCAWTGKEKTDIKSPKKFARLAGLDRKEDECRKKVQNNNLSGQLGPKNKNVCKR